MSETPIDAYFGRKIDKIDLNFSKKIIHEEPRGKKIFFFQRLSRFWRGETKFVIHKWIFF